jgi:hypothetical protein
VTETEFLVSVKPVELRVPPPRACTYGKPPDGGFAILGGKSPESLEEIEANEYL